MSDSGKDADLMYRSKMSVLDFYSSRHLVLSHLGLAFVLILKPFSPEFDMFPDFDIRTPRHFDFAKQD